jgi:DEAD/DEAH box helicase domain-containing protein
VIACFECRNLTEFEQVSARRDARSISVTPAGLRPGPWTHNDERNPGIHCATCHRPVDADAATLGLVDNRVSFVAPENLDIEALASEMQGVRADAEWRRLDLPARDARYRDLRHDLSEPVGSALAAGGRAKLYVHQAEAIDAALDGSNVVQATSAGSGKSIGLIVPVLEHLVADQDATALLVYPLRALANDQLDSLSRYGGGSTWMSNSACDLQLTASSDPIRVARLDGSTSQGDRKEIRRRARLLVTTPDALHAVILRFGQHHYKDGTSWARFLSGLRVVVLDELHVYQGVFGSNVALVMRRLRRMAAYHGATPQFLAASATIGNPQELSQAVTGVSPFVCVDDDGSTRDHRIVLVCNPPVRSPGEAPLGPGVSHGSPGALGGGRPIDGPAVGRIAPQTIAIDLVAAALVSPTRHPVRTIAFSKSRNSVFQLNQRIQRELKRRGQGDLARTVKPYAATFLADDRQRIEGQLRDGTMLAVVSTNALELGIDIPDLSLAVLVGYPGQLSSFRQRAGRVGRRGPGLVVLVVGDDPLQQYIARNDDALRALLDAPPEDVVVNPEAQSLADRFGLAPAHEESDGISPEDARYFGWETVERWLGQTDPLSVRQVRGVDFYRLRKPAEWPQNLRSATSSDSYTVYAQSGRERTPVGVVDAATGPRDAFVPAVWTGPDGELYRVIDVLHQERSVICEGPLDLEYQTRGILVDRVTVLREHRGVEQTTTGPLAYGQFSIERFVVAYKKQHFSGAETNQDLEQPWPPVDFVTDGLRLEVDEERFDSDQERDECLKAVEHVLLSVAPVVVACDPADLESSRDRNVIYLYDSFGGGLRMSEPIFDRFAEVVALAHDVVATCPCATGCPSCVMLTRRPDSNVGLSKAGALTLLSALRRDA